MGSVPLKKAGGGVVEGPPGLSQLAIILEPNFISNADSHSLLPILHSKSVGNTIAQLNHNNCLLAA